MTTTAASSITYTSVTLGGNITSNGGGKITERGVLIGTLPYITTLNKVIEGGTSTGVFSLISTGLTSNTLYYIRAYAINNTGTGYGNQISFSTLTSAVPTLVTTAITNITQTTASSGGNTINDNGSSITAKGVCWSGLPNPTIADNITVDGAGNGNFNSYMSKLFSDTYYHVRAYATNLAGTGYGEEIDFKTSGGSFPFAQTLSPSFIGPREARLEGIAGGNGREVSWRFEYGTDTSYGKTVNEPLCCFTGTLHVSATAYNLSENTIYHYRLLVSTIETAKGNDMMFSTLPIVITQSSTNVTSSGAILNGSVYTDYIWQDNSWIISFDYGITPDYGNSVSVISTPDRSNTYTNVSTNLSGLNPGTTFHYRIRAVYQSIYNPSYQYISYGADMIFNTL